MFALYLNFYENQQTFASTHIKFGGFDNNNSTITAGSEALYIKTMHSKSWDLELHVINVGSIDSIMPS